MEMRVRLMLLATCAALVAATPAAAADRVVERGIVQSIDPNAVVLRALDGTDVRIALDPATSVRLNGRAVTLDRIRPGLVAEAVTVGNGPARVLRAFGRVDPAVERGVLVQLRPRAILLERDGGVRVRIPLGLRTTVWRDGRRVRIRSLRPGLRLEVTLGANGSARVVRVVRGG
jgi:hypothetical protein